MNIFMKVLGYISLGIQRVGEVFLVINTSALVCITFYGVIMRYLLNAPVVWLMELSIIMYAWLTFIGAAIAFKRHQHIKINILENRLQGVAKKYLLIFIQVLVLVFIFFAFFGGMQLVQATLLQRYRTVNLPVAVFFAPLVFSMAMSFVFVIERTIMLILTKSEEFKKEAA